MQFTNYNLSLTYVLGYHFLNIFLGTISIHLLASSYNYVFSPFIIIFFFFLYLGIEFLKVELQNHIFEKRKNLIFVIFFTILFVFSLNSNLICIDRINEFETNKFNQFAKEQKAITRKENDKLYLLLHQNVYKASFENKAIIPKLNKEFHKKVDNNNICLKENLKENKPFQIRVKNIFLLFIAMELLSIICYFKYIAFREKGLVLWKPKRHKISSLSALKKV